MTDDSNEPNKKSQELEEKNQKLMETIDMLERELDKTQTKLSQIQHTVEKIVQIAFPNDFKLDLDYISLIQCLNGDESHQIKLLPYHIEKHYRKTGEAPTLEEYHNQLLELLKIEGSDKINYPIELSINMLNNLKDPIYMNRFTFLNKILED
ncbi:hypothetical protein [Bacillus multifaciens]|uniref:hypothetical protein n=1 Tax=Bacillus multifaciens TaxID=3068506 RepID=UPI002741DB6F|nr:hypothetical protein [Bacillus sp. WLY-B-L8]